MLFKGWQKTSLNEWPGKVCSVVFISGCNFRCPFCYNKDLVLFPDKLPNIKSKDVLNYCFKNKDLIDGVMITGGEPLQNKKLNIKYKKRNTKNKLAKHESSDGAEKLEDDLVEFIKQVRKINLKVGLETNGSNPEMLEYLVKNKLIDYVAMDIKAPLNQGKYNQLTGIKIDLQKIKKSIKIIKNLPSASWRSEFRTTVIPGWHSQKDLIEIAEELKGLKGCYYLQKFIKSGETLGVTPKAEQYSDDWFRQTEQEINKIIKKINLRI
jgi:pyruvate formate lyase activating enzyme